MKQLKPDTFIPRTVRCLQLPIACYLKGKALSTTGASWWIHVFPWVAGITLVMQQLLSKEDQQYGSIQLLPSSLWGACWKLSGLTLDIWRIGSSIIFNGRIGLKYKLSYWEENVTLDHSFQGKYYTELYLILFLCATAVFWMQTWRLLKTLNSSNRRPKRAWRQQQSSSRLKVYSWKGNQVNYLSLKLPLFSFEFIFHFFCIFCCIFVSCNLSLKSPNLQTQTR